VETSLRERKKQRTREQIADAAMNLFLERGFDAVTVAEVARAADVAEKTVYNYFPTKEDLVYDRLEAFEDALLGAIESRAPGESIADAFVRFLLSAGGMLGGAEAQRARMGAVSAMIVASPSLLAREHQIFARYTASLAALLARETAARPQDVRPWVVANALIGVHRALIEYVRRETIAGKSAVAVSRGMRARARAVLELLSNGLGDYGRRR
jgi:AcrR family transcriptional regulator